MRRLVAGVILFAASPALGGPPARPIFGGTPATLGEFANVVAISIGTDELCTGSLVAKDWVVTAAHCVFPGGNQPTQADVTASIKVHFNTIDIVQDPGTVVLASDSFPHPEFRQSITGKHDIGLIKLATPMTAIVPARVNLMAAKAPVGIAITQVGFGITTTGGVRKLFSVAQTSVSCPTVHTGPNFTDANLICADQSNGTGQCRGDSGGPTFAMIDGTAWQVALSSFGDPMCLVYGASTRTDVEAPFLIANIPEIQCELDTDCAAEQICFHNTCIAEPFAPMGIGSACTTASECESGQCAAGPDGMRCIEGCVPGEPAACPEGFECLAAGGAQGACWPNEGGGCCDASGAGAPATTLVGICVIIIGLRKRRR